MSCGVALSLGVDIGIVRIVIVPAVVAVVVASSSVLNRP